MTNRDWILYIIQNGLEDKPMFENGKLAGFVSPLEFASKYGVGEACVIAWVELGYVDALIIHDEIFIPCNAEVKGVKVHEK